MKSEDKTLLHFSLGQLAGISMRMNSLIQTHEAMQSNWGELLTLCSELEERLRTVKEALQEDV